MHSIRHLSPCIRAFDSPRVCLVVTPEVAVFLFGWCLKFMITSIGGDFTRGCLYRCHTALKSKGENRLFGIPRSWRKLLVSEIIHIAG